MQFKYSRDVAGKIPKTYFFPATLFILYIITVYFLLSIDKDLREFAAASGTASAVAFADAFSRTRFVIIFLGAISVLGTYFYLWSVDRSLKQEMSSFIKIVNRSHKTNMILNPHSFSMNQMRVLAEAYNQATRKKMEDFTRHTGMISEIRELKEEAKNELDVSKRVLGVLPLPVALYNNNSDGFILDLFNVAFSEVFPLAAEGSEYTFGLEEEQAKQFRYYFDKVAKHRVPAKYEDIIALTNTTIHIFPLMDQQDKVLQVGIMLESSRPCTQ